MYKALTMIDPEPLTLDYIRKMNLEAYAYLLEGTRLLEQDIASAQSDIPVQPRTEN